MFKMIMLVKRKKGLSREAFLRYWQAHSASVMAYREVLRIRRYTKTLPVAAPQEHASGLAIQRTPSSFDWDAMGEIWYDSQADFLQVRATQAARQALARLHADERTFVDMEASVLWFGEETAVIRHESDCP